MQRHMSKETGCICKHVYGDGVTRLCKALLVLPALAPERGLLLGYYLKTSLVYLSWVAIESAPGAGGDSAIGGLVGADVGAHTLPG